MKTKRKFEFTKTEIVIGVIVLVMLLVASLVLSYVQRKNAELQVSSIEAAYIEAAKADSIKIADLKKTITDKDAEISDLEASSKRKAEDLFARMANVNPFNWREVDVAAKDQLKAFEHFQEVADEGMSAGIYFNRHNYTSGFHSEVHKKLKSLLYEGGAKKPNMQIVLGLYNKNRTLILGTLKAFPKITQYLGRVYKNLNGSRFQPGHVEYFENLQKKHPGELPWDFIDEDVKQFKWTKQEAIQYYTDWWWAQRRHSDGSAQVLLIIFNDMFK